MVIYQIFQQLLIHGILLFTYHGISQNYKNDSYGFKQETAIADTSKSPAEAPQRKRHLKWVPSGCLCCQSRGDRGCLTKDSVKHRKNGKAQEEFILHSLHISNVLNLLVFLGFTIILHNMTAKYSLSSNISCHLS